MQTSQRIKNSEFQALRKTIYLLAKEIKLFQGKL